MRTIKATESRRYADSEPHLPIRELLSGVTYTDEDLSNYIMDSALKNGFAEEIKMEFDDDGELIRETKVITPESKEKGVKGKKHKK